LDPRILREDEALELLAEVLHHIVALRLSVNENVESNLLLEADHSLDLVLDELLVLLLRDLALGELGTSLTNLLGLLQKIYELA
jgi:hypothetical protein